MSVKIITSLAAALIASATFATAASAGPKFSPVSKQALIKPIFHKPIILPHKPIRPIVVVRPPQPRQTVNVGNGGSVTGYKGKANGGDYNTVNGNGRINGANVNVGNGGTVNGAKGQANGGSSNTVNF